MQLSDELARALLTEPQIRKALLCGAIRLTAIVQEDRLRRWQHKTGRKHPCLARDGAPGEHPA